MKFLNYSLLRNCRFVLVRMLPIFPFLFSMAGGIADAAVYEWIDERGVMNFTDSRDKIPDKYRAIAREKQLSDGKNISVIREGNRSSSSGATGEKLYSGHPAGWWRTNLANMRSQIKVKEDELADKRQKLSQLNHRRVVFQKPGDRIAYQNLQKEIDGSETELRKLHEKMNALQSAAEAAGVPPE